MIDKSETIFGHDKRNCAFYISLKQEKPVKTLVDQIYDRYNDLIDLNGQFTYSLSYKSSQLIRENIGYREGFIPKLDNVLDASDVNIETKTSPRLLASVSLVLNGKEIRYIGDCCELEKVCMNVQELDLSKNNFDDWNEIKKLVVSLKKLRLLNLSSNPLSNACNKLESIKDKNSKGNDQFELLIDYFNNEWNNLNISNGEPVSLGNFESNLNTLILNSCFIDLRIIELLIKKLNNLKELHLSLNNYSTINFSKSFTQPSLKILYFNNNCLEDWDDVLKLGACFPSLESLVISENAINNFGHSSFKNRPCVFNKIQTIMINKFMILDWNCINFVEFPQIKHVRIQNIPLLETYTKEEKYDLLVGHLEDNIETLNGGKISKDEKKSCELKYLSYFAKLNEKPDRYYELEFKHRKICKFSNNDDGKLILVKIDFNGKCFYKKFKNSYMWEDFEKQTEQITGCPAGKSKIYKTRSITGERSNETIEINSMDDIKDGDELKIELINN